MPKKPERRDSKLRDLQLARARERARYEEELVARRMEEIRKVEEEKWYVVNTNDVMPFGSYPTIPTPKPYKVNPNPPYQVRISPSDFFPDPKPLADPRECPTCGNVWFEPVTLHKIGTDATRDDGSQFFPSQDHRVVYRCVECGETTKVEDAEDDGD